MNLSYTKIKTLFPQFNVEPLTEDLFWKTAKQMRIVVRHELLMVDGYYTRKKGRHIIVIDSRLRGLKRLHTLWHEFFHFLLDVPPGKADITLYRSRAQERSKQELTVDALALVALIPMVQLEKYRHTDLQEDPDLFIAVRDRIVVLADYKF